LSWLGVTLDSEANAASAQVISRKDSRVTVYVIPTNEELMIARHTLDLISKRAERAAE
jgi:acetate kinase